MGKNPLDLLSFRKRNDVLSQLPSNIALLKKIAGSTEKEFLQVGEKLQEFYQTAQDISKAASEIAEKMSGGDMMNIREELGKVSGVIAGASGGMTSEKNVVRAILSSFAALRLPLGEFEKVVRNLNILCNFIKIEIARLGQTDTSFVKLSEDVQALARVIGGKIESLVDQADAAMPSLNKNLSAIENCDARQKDEGRLILEKIGNNLDALASANDASVNTISDISANWLNISQHIGEVVQSIQFHDITRQRVEHAYHALEELPQMLVNLKKEKRNRYTHWMMKNKGESSGNVLTNGVHPDDLIADTFELQEAQLQGANQDLSDAVGRILDNLRMVATDATAISEKLTQVTGLGASGKGSFMHELERDINELSSSARDVAQIKKDLTIAMNTLSQTALGMSGFMKEMDRISIEMQRLALNARVHAAHIGERGATLGVLSESIHQLSLDTSSKVESITTHLQSVVENAGKLSDLACAENNEASGSMIWIQEKFSALLGALQKIEKEINELLLPMNQSGVRLGDDVEHLIHDLDIHISVSRDVAFVNAYLRGAAGAMQGGHRRRVAHQKANIVEALSAKYTMDRERETHSAAAGMALQKTDMKKQTVQIEGAMPASQVAKSGQDETLGDNVELF